MPICIICNGSGKALDTKGEPTEIICGDCEGVGLVPEGHCYPAHGRGLQSRNIVWLSREELQKRNEWHERQLERTCFDCIHWIVCFMAKAIDDLITENRRLSLDGYLLANVLTPGKCFDLYKTLAMSCTVFTQKPGSEERRSGIHMEDT